MAKVRTQIVQLEMGTFLDPLFWLFAVSLPFVLFWTPVVELNVDFAPCATPHMKLGIYRPGESGHGRSTLLLDANFADQVN